MAVLHTLVALRFSVGDSWLASVELRKPDIYGSSGGAFEAFSGGVGDSPSTSLLAFGLLQWRTSCLGTDGSTVLHTLVASPSSGSASWLALAELRDGSAGSHKLPFIACINLLRARADSDPPPWLLAGVLSPVSALPSRCLRCRLYASIRGSPPRLLPAGGASSCFSVIHSASAEVDGMSTP